VWFGVWQALHKQASDEYAVITCYDLNAFLIPSNWFIKNWYEYL